MLSSLANSKASGGFFEEMGQSCIPETFALKLAFLFGRGREGPLAGRLPENSYQPSLQV